MGLATYLSIQILAEGAKKAVWAPADRGRAKAAVWALSTLLTTMFAARVAPLVPLPVGVAVWAVAAVTAGGGFWALFISH